MFIYKDNKRSIEVVSEDNFYDSNKKFNKERYYDLGRYFHRISTFMDNFSKDSEKFYLAIEEYEKSHVCRIRALIRSNKYPELAEFIKENSYEVKVIVTKNNKTKTFNDTKYTDELYSVMSLYHSLNGYEDLIIQAKNSLRATYNMTEFYSDEPREECREEFNTLNMYKMLIRQSQNALKKHPDNLQVFFIARTIFEHVHLNVKLETRSYEYGFEYTTLKDVPILSTEEKQYLEQLSQKLNKYCLPQGEHSL